MRALALAIVCSVLAGCVTTGSSNAQLVQPVEQGSSSSFQQFLRALAGPVEGTAWHDPQDGTPLFQQIPNWDGAAMKRCCSALNREEFLKARCDTDQPIYPRTNRC